MQKQQLIIFPLHQTTWDVVDSGTQINSSTWVAPESNSYEKSTQALSTWTLVFIEKINLCVFGLLSTQTLVFQVTSTWKLSPGWRYSRTLTETPDEALVASTTTSIQFFCFIWYQLHCDSKKLGSYVNSLQSFSFNFSSFQIVFIWICEGWLFCCIFFYSTSTFLESRLFYCHLPLPFASM